MKYGLSDKNLKNIIEIITKNSSVEKVLLFGSRAKGNFKEASDIDLCLVGDKLALDDQLKIANDLDDLLLPYTFDLCIFHKVSNQEFIDHINKVGIELI